MSLSAIFFSAAVAAMLGVACTLLGGIYAMTRDGQGARKTSNKVMRLRVFLQALAILFLFLAWWVK